MCIEVGGIDAGFNSKLDLGTQFPLYFVGLSILHQYSRRTVEVSVFVEQARNFV
jgi:hypothetical protein